MLWKGNSKVLKKMHEPKKFSDSESKSTILRLTAGMRNSRLLFGTPGNQVIAKVNRITRGRATSIRTFRPVSIKVSN